MPELSQKRCLKLAKELEADATGKANHVVELVAALTSAKDQDWLPSVIQPLKLFFVDSWQAGDVANKRQKVADDSQSSDPVAAYSAWLRRQYDRYVSALLQLLTSSMAASGPQVAAFSALMECVRSGKVGVFDNVLYEKILYTAVLSTHLHPEVFSLLFQKYLNHADVRFYTLVTVKDISLARPEQLRPQSSTASAATTSPSNVPSETGTAHTLPDVSTTGIEGNTPADNVTRNLYDILNHVSPQFDPEDVTSWCGAAEVGAVKAATDKGESARARRKRQAEEQQAGKAAVKTAGVAWANAKNQRRAFSDAWLALLNREMPADLYKRLLLHLHEQVMPAMTNPLMLADFLTYALNQGGMVGMIALNSIFVLVTRHGLEYPAFYARLYQLLTPAALRAKYRVTFFKLADVFMASGLVPAYTVAAFCKRFARLALGAGPAGAMTATAFIHNLIRRHPALMCLIHKPTKEVSGVGDDVYDESQPDPALSRAVESSLWELAALRNHVIPQVSAFVTVLDKDLSERTKTSEVDLDPLLRTSYKGLFTQEVTRKLRKPPAIAFFKTPRTTLFDGAELAFFGGIDL